MTSAGTGMDVYFFPAVIIAMKADAPEKSRAFVGRPLGVESQVCRNSSSGIRNPNTRASHRCKAPKSVRSEASGVGEFGAPPEASRNSFIDGPLPLSNAYGYPGSR